MNPFTRPPPFPRNVPVGLTQPDGIEHAMLDVKDTQLGRNQRISRTDAPKSVLFAKGRSQQALIATVHTQVIVPLDAYAGAPGDRRAPIVGLLKWGQGAANFTAEIDIRNGTSFSVVAADVSLDMVFEKADTDPDTRALSADVAAAVVWGTRPGRSRPTRTLGRVTIATGTSHTFPVPAFAYAVAFYMPTAAQYAAAATSTITLHEGPDVTDDPELVVTMGELGTTPLTLDGLLLSGNTRFVTFTNNSGGNLTIRPTFALEL